MAFFVCTGIGIYYVRPKADLFKGSVDIDNRYFFWSDGTIRDQAQSSGQGNVIEKDGEYETDLIDCRTEGQGSYDKTNKTKSMYIPWHIEIPIANGIRYGLNKNITLSVEFG